MSAEVQALSASFPAEPPTADLEYLIAVLTGKEKLERLKGVKAAYGIVGYLLGKFLGQATAESVAKPKKLSKKQLAEQLQGLAAGVQPKAFPTWLIPILLDLAVKWVQNQK